MNDPSMVTLLAVVFGALVLGSIAAAIVARTARSDRGRSMARNLAARMRSWWIMAGVFVASVLIGGVGTIVLFAASSFLAFREFITLTPTRRGDHRALFWAFFFVIPIQYLLVAQERYGLFSIFIPVYAFILIPARIAAAGETESFLERTSKIQWGLLSCVYFVSHVPAILTLDIPGSETSNAALLFFLVLIVQLNDVFQYIVGSLFGRRPLAPRVSPNKTIEGMIGGLVGSVAVGAAMSTVTPFGVAGAAGLAAAIAVMGVLGDLTMSAVKRDLGVKDYSDLIPGHGGVLDRLDSLTFAAPVFFHLTRYFYSGDGMTAIV
ncbi:MAG: phosphatidate cytidylyltransferase [Planctomycetota bacterium]